MRGPYRSPPPPRPTCALHACESEAPCSSCGAPSCEACEPFALEPRCARCATRLGRGRRVARAGAAVVGTLALAVVPFVLPGAGGPFLGGARTPAEREAAMVMWQRAFAWRSCDHQFVALQATLLYERGRDPEVIAMDEAFAEKCGGDEVLRELSRRAKSHPPRW